MLVLSNVLLFWGGLPWWLSSKESACNVGDTGNVSSTPGSGGSLEGGHGNPLWYCCLENSTDRVGWWTTIQRVTESDTTEQWAPNSSYFCGLSIIFFSLVSDFVCLSSLFFWWVWPKVYQFCLSFQRTDLCFICFYYLLISILFICSNPFFLSYYSLCSSLYFFFFFFFILKFL